MPRHKRLGEVLINEGMITEEQLKNALSLQDREGVKLGEALIKLKYIEEEQVVAVLSKQLSIPYISLSSGKLKPQDETLKTVIPYEFAVRNLVLPLSRNLNYLTISFFDPMDLMLMDNLKKLSGCEINPVISTRNDLLKAIDSFYGKQKAFKKAIADSYEIKESDEIAEDTDTQLNMDKLIAKTEEGPVIKLVDLIIRQAIEERASDIHIEPQRDKLSLRYRIDGVLYGLPSPSKNMQLALISRIKILSKMNIAEHRLPQDGAFMVKMGERRIDLRVSVIPVIYGEKVVIRILDKSRIPLELEKLGFLPQELSLIKKGLTFSYGLIFLTGPTGSGKSTTLYAALNGLNDASRNIITAEDPVEYRMEGVNQVHVKPDIGLTFSNLLRSFLRQDPDIILVGEARDLETAEMCIRAALTGHLVLSTLHTNGASDAIVRLVDMGIPNYLVASAIRLIVSQRLVRKLCPYCKVPHELDKSDLLQNINLTTSVVYDSKGCKKCNFIGFKGRTVIAEVIFVDEDIRNAVYKNFTPCQISDIAHKQGTLTLLESGLKRVEEGVISLEEVLSLSVY